MSHDFTLGVKLSSRACASHVQGPGFNPEVWTSQSSSCAGYHILFGGLSVKNNTNLFSITVIGIAKHLVYTLLYFTHFKGT